ncbi:class C sortase [uncultured Tessaracoccus sp.]|uniref:class C sortase n=1 Tax=uncultured Tessaracoccus sp. TaxID=905023 RepID=UPI0025CEA939|nr:class C sortase [uncultured Tessaracoccus sp.]
MSTVTTPPAETSAPQPKPRRRRPVIPVLLLVVGIIVMLYPVAATQYNNVRQQQFANEYGQQVGQVAKEDLSSEIAAAKEYNSTLSGVPILDPYLLDVAQDPGSQQYRRYTSQLSRFDVMARVRVPSAQIDLPVRHGTSDPVIAAGAGHLYGTSLPVGGEGTHSVLTSHRGLSDATLFDHLDQVREGDLMYVDVLGETLAYKVDQIKVVLPDEIGDLKSVPGHDYLTLFTCTPYAVNSHRLLVRGERVPYTPEMAQQDGPDGGIHLQMQGWMWWLIAGSAVGIGGVAFIIVRERRRRRAA